MNTRGRRRKGGERGKTDRLLQRPDRGVQKLRQHRAWLSQQVSAGGDPMRTVYPLGIMFTNGTIGDAEHDAGCRYAWLHALVFGRTTVAGARYDEMQGRDDFEPDAKWIKARRCELDIADEGFASRKERDLVTNLVVFERTPQWLMPVPPTQGDVIEARRTIAGLNNLALALGRKTKGAA